MPTGQTDRAGPDQREGPAAPADVTEYLRRADQYEYRAELAARHRPGPGDDRRRARRRHPDDAEVDGDRHDPRERDGERAREQRAQTVQRPTFADEGELQHGDESRAAEGQRRG